MPEQLTIPWGNRTLGLEFEFTRSVSQEVLAGAVRYALPDISPDLIGIRDWEHNNDNREWLVKRDGSCGWEVITPRLDGTQQSLDDACAVLEACRKVGAQVSPRCGVHIHLGTQEISESRVGRIVAHWVRFEGMIFWSLPRKRRANQFCMSISRSGDFRPGRTYNSGDLIQACGSDRYRALNIRPWQEGHNRIEYRPIEATLDPTTVWNWAAFLMYFTERACHRDIPQDLRWLSLEESMQWLDWEDRSKLHPDLAQVRDWWLRRIIRYSSIRQKNHQCRQKAKEYLQNEC